MLQLPMSARTACNLFFVGAGAGIGCWAASLPVLAAQNGLDKGELGLVLLCFALGAILMMINVGRLTAHHGSGSISFVAAIGFAAVLFAIPYVGGIGWLAFSVFLAGAAFGTLDVSMNIYASEIERRLDRHIMSSFHGVFSVGSLLGAFLVGQILSRGGGLAICLGVTAVGIACLAMLGVLGSRSTPDIGQRPHRDVGVQIKLDPAKRPRLLLLGALAFLGLLAEGGMMDWSAVYIVTVLGAPDSLGAYGFAAFATMMAVGRLVGDRITARVGFTRLMLGSALTCAVSVVVFVMTPNLGVAYIALAACGLGVANVVPAIFAAAGRAGGAAAGHAMSLVTTMGYAGLLLGPALLGFVAQASSLAVSFGVVTFAFLLIVAGTKLVARQ